MFPRGSDHCLQRVRSEPATSPTSTPSRSREPEPRIEEIAAHEVSLDNPTLAAVLTRGLRFDPDERFATMNELASALAAAIAPPRVR